ncbi:chitin synthase chs-2-like [Daphnia carinata]|uniref:chitin synthase chs-2-like n=1 Tax=Daphnia carinata TaxID=120202 RepID=UPI00257A3EBA|nr:chitin synthase chs-2-like [Daphnia carinata]
MGKRNLKLCGKLIACCVAFIVVLSAGLASKASIFFMTSSMGQELKETSTGGPHRYTSGDDPIRHAEHFACWMWGIFFSFVVPELFSFLQLLYICLCRRDCWKSPRSVVRSVDLPIVFLFETAQAVGMAILFGSILPCLSVVHGIVVTNCIYLVPALFNLLSRKPDEPKPLAKMTLDGIAFLAQLSGCLHWIFIRSTTASLGNHYSSSFTQRHQLVDWTLPVSLFLISLGWWENHVDKDASVGFIKFLGRIKEEMKTRPLIQIFLILWKTLIFLGTMLICTSVIIPEGHIPETNLSSFLFLIKQGLYQFWSSAMSVDWTSPFYIFIIQATASLLFFCFGTFACKIGAQRYGFAFSVVIITPVLISTLTMAHFNIVDPLPIPISFRTDNDDNQPIILLALSFIWILSQIWITRHIWEPVELAFQMNDTKWYNSLLIDHSLNLSSPRYRDQEDATSGCLTNCTITSRIFAVATMWHESSDEMMTILKSIFRLDKDQSERRVNRDCSKVIDPHLYHYETHIFFDDAFESGTTDSATSRVVNQFVNEFIAMVDKVNSQWTNSTSPQSPTVSVTPYGGRLVWVLPANTKMAVHLKDRTKIRVKKRWSQVMYIDYLIRYEMANCLDMTNVFILSLDGDMDFQPKAVHTLVDLMNSQKDVSIVCNRSHPTGSIGAMVWYQMFEYAVGFWLLKPSEDLLGSILCASGCFSLIRASVLLDEEIMAKFTTVSEEAHHMIQRDQGEDRWLCTLLIKRGYRLAYSANSSAYTHCPETFEEFYNQRRRWALSLLANTLDVLWNCRQIVKINPNISWLYIAFQAVLLTIGLLCPGSVFLALVYTSATTFYLSPWISLTVHSVLIFIFVFTCFLVSTRVQLMIAKCLSVLYGLLLVAALVHWLTAMSVNSGIQMLWSIHNVFFLCLASCIFLAGCLHPSEIQCLLAGPVYLLLTPSMSILLLLYSIINMNIVSWGTRDSNPPATARPTTEIPTKVTKYFANEMEQSIVNGTENLQISDGDGQKMNATDQLSKDACSQPCKTTDSEEASVSRTSIPSLSDQHVHRIGSLDWNLETEVKLSKQLRNVKCLSHEEDTYWNNLIAQKLSPIVDNSQEHKERISIDLIRLRNWSFTFFILLNSLFVALIFGMQANDNLISQGVNSTDSLTHHDLIELTSLNDGRLSQTSPVHIILVSLAGLMLFIQFAALLIFRVKNLIRILSSVHFTSLCESSPRMDSSVVLTRFNQNGENLATTHHTELRQLQFIS